MILRKINNILLIGKIVQIHKNKMIIKVMMDKEEQLNLIYNKLIENIKKDKKYQEN